MSFCVSAQMAVNRVVIDPRHNIAVMMWVLLEVSGWNRTIRKMPATTIVLECSRADTGVGPSMADGSQGCNPNWADFPVAAIRRPASGTISELLVRKICCSSQELECRQNQAIDKINPMSPMRLYRIACRAAVLASVRPYHHPIRRKDMIPTPSHPINSWNKLLADVKMIIVIRNVRRYLTNRSRCGSECMYHDENSIIDQVTNNATDRKIMQKKSSFRLIDSFIVLIVNQCQLVIRSSVLEWKKEVSGIRLIMKAYLIDFVT